MRRLITHLERAHARHQANHDRGAVAVIVALCMVVILGFVALAIDAGAMYQERAELQSAADAAALAVAQECASGGDCSQDAAEALALKYAKANLKDDTVSVEDVILTGETAQVNVLTEDSAGNNDLSLTFAPILGIDSVKVGATATAQWGFPHKGPAKLPIIFNECVFTYDDAPKMHQLQRAQTPAAGLQGAGVIGAHVMPVISAVAAIVPMGVGEPEPDPDPDPECVDKAVTLKPDGFGFVLSDDGCAIDSVEVGTFVDGKEGIDFPVECNSVLHDSINKVVLVPLFDEIEDQVTWNRYKVTGWAAFELHGYNLGDGISGGDVTAGTGKGLYGKFIRNVDLAEADYVFGGPDYGASLVTLID